MNTDSTAPNGAPKPIPMANLTNSPPQLNPVKRQSDFDVPPPVPPKDFPVRRPTVSTVTSGEASPSIVTNDSPASIIRVQWVATESPATSSQPTESGHQRSLTESTVSSNKTHKTALSISRANGNPINIKVIKEEERAPSPTFAPSRPAPTPAPPPVPSAPATPAPAAINDSKNVNIEYRPWTATTMATPGTGRTLKFGTGKHAKIELSPQPSDSVDDPLNWPRWRKELNFVSLLLWAGLVAGMKTAFVSTSGTMVQQMDSSFASVANLTAMPLIIASFSGLASLVASKFWGKRPVYLASALCLFIGSIWNMTTVNSLSSSMGARFFQGLGWGAFDTLVLGSIYDTYFEHERRWRVAIYNVFIVAITWGAPLLGGTASQTAGSFAVQFQIINVFYAVAIPLILLGAPETSFDRSMVVGYLPSPALQRLPYNSLRTKKGIIDYLQLMKPLVYTSKLKVSTGLQGPRAFVCPTTGLIFLLTMIPYGTLWSFTASLGWLFGSDPVALNVEGVGALMAGSFMLSILIVSVACIPFVRRLLDQPLENLCAVAASSALVSIGILAFGLHIHDVLRWAAEPSQTINLGLASFLLGLLAAGFYALDATTAPLIARSTAFTCSSIAVAHRTTVDMHAGVVFWRNLAAGIFVATIPTAMSTLSGLRETALGLGITNILLAAGVTAAWWFFDERLCKGDGVVMNLVDLSLLKRSVISIN